MERGSISLLQQSSKLELGVRSQESGGKKKKEEGRRKKEGAIISVFTNMRCSLERKFVAFLISTWQFQILPKD
ncbi:hypothetical protein [Microcoleus sp. D2_18a_B4]|uniref:hypothetical protein n=1 Tax=Microcoleus sp. D2_18a_B4 TaxID=3055329 RepID=UPI002FD56156